MPVVGQVRDEFVLRLSLLPEATGEFLNLPHPSLVIGYPEPPSCLTKLKAPAVRGVA